MHIFIFQLNTTDLMKIEHIRNEDIKHILGTFEKYFVIDYFNIVASNIFVLFQQCDDLIRERDLFVVYYG